MGQIEVYAWLKNRRKMGSDDFYSIEDIRQGLKSNGLRSSLYNSVRVACIQLEAHGYLEAKMTGKFHAWHRLFRLKEEYIK